MQQAVLVRRLTRAQQARRRRVIDAALALANEGGYEAVQMREVAARAQVALGTVYRYFSSKDHLLAAALLEWVEQLVEHLQEHPPAGATARERVMAALDRGLRAMARQPRAVGALFVALSSTDPAAVDCQQQASMLMTQIVTRAVGEQAPPDAPDRARIIGHVWYSALVGWVTGWSSMDRVHDELEIAVRLLLPDDGAAGLRSARGRSDRR
jgi:AcrR family transcriptional regulator